MKKFSLFKKMAFLAMLFFMAVGSKAQSNAAHKRYNVLFIAVDDMNNDLGLYGNKVVSSPSLDKFASEAVAFSHAYCQYPLCSPSRSSVLTGLRPDSTRVFDLHYHFRQGLPYVVTLPEMFRLNGYYVARVGKMFHYGNPGDIGTNGLDDKISWTERYNPAGLDKTALEIDIINFTPKRGLGSSLAYYDDPKGTDEQHTDGKVADRAIELMKKHGHGKEPFFIGAGFYKPHCPWITPKKYFDLYKNKKIKVPRVDDKTKASYPPLALASTRPWPDFGVTRAQAKQSKLAYFAAISFVDAQIGRVLHALDSLGLKDSTIVVFWSDHGYQLGEHGLWFKRSLFEESTKCPLIIAYPGMKTAGKVCAKPVELLDIFPTLIHLTGMKMPDNIQGYSLTPLLENVQDTQWNHPAYSQVYRHGKIPGYSVRTERWRYSEWAFGKQGVELYDENNDPHEMHNLASDPKYADVVKKLKGMLDKMHPHWVKKGKALPDTKALWCD